MIEQAATGDRKNEGSDEKAIKAAAYASHDVPHPHPGAVIRVESSLAVG